MSGLIPPPPLPGLSSLSGSSRPSSNEILNHAAFLPLLTSEMALRLAAAAAAAQAGSSSGGSAADIVPPAGAVVPPPPPPPPQVIVKHGDSKCLECNIVFYKHENYIAHKKHYCSARKHSDVSSQEVSIVKNNIVTIKLCSYYKRYNFLYIYKLNMCHLTKSFTHSDK